MTFYDIFTYLCTFTIIIPLAVFCLFPVIDHLKTPIRHLLIKISLVFVCYFVLLIIPYMIFQQDLGNILVFLAVPVFFYLFQKETNLMLPASLFVMLTACCLGSLSYVIYHTFGVIFHPHGQSTEFYPESMIAQLIFLVFADIILYKPARNISAGWLRISTMPLSGELRVFSHAVLLFSFLLIFHTIIMIFIPIMIYMFTFP